MPIRVAVVGTGLMGQGIISTLKKFEDIEVVAVADIDLNALEKAKPYLSKKVLVSINVMDIFKKKPDVLIEATSTILEAAYLVIQAIKHGIHVVLLNSQVDQLFGRLLAKKAEAEGLIYSSDAGDQHGVLARMIKKTCNMGFELVLAGNNKGFLNQYANSESIKKEAAKRRLSLRQCVAFSDGTKLAIEMALVANGFGLNLLQPGMTGPMVENAEDILKVFNLDRARKLGGVVDFIFGAKLGGSVFVITYAKDALDRFYMSYYKMGEGPYYLFIRPYHLCHFETPLAIRRIMDYNEPILVQKKRFLEVGCRAKKDLQRRTKLEGFGGNHLYGVLEKPGNLPIGLAENTILLTSKKKGEIISWDDVKFLKDDFRLELWEEQTRIEK